MSHYTMKGFISALLLLALPVSCFGITLEAAVQYALDHGESAGMIRQGARETLEAGRGAGAFAKPQLSLEGAWTEMDGNGDGDSPTPDREISGEVTLKQAIFAGGKIRASLALEENYRHRSKLQESSGYRDITREVKALFVNVLHKQAELAIFQDRLGQRQMELGDATDLRDNGYATFLDVRQAMHSLNVVTGELIAAKRGLSDALTDFNIVLGIPPGADPMVPEGDLAKAPNMAALERELQKRLEKGDLLDIFSDSALVDGAQLDYRIAGSELFPTASLFLSGKTAGEETKEMTESLAAGVMLQWNLFSGGLVRSQKAAAWARLKKARARFSLTKKELKARSNSLGVRKIEVEERIKLQKESVTLAKENYEDARGHYRAGTITLTRLGEFSLSYAEARFSLQSLFLRQRELASDIEQLLEQ